MPLRKKLRNGVGIVLKHTLNPLTRRIARSSHGPFAIVRHVGRRSGKQYETPIIVGPPTDGFVIELTYGPEVDWYKNVQAAGRCIIHWHDNDYVIDKIEPLDGEAGRAAFPQPARWFLRVARLKHFAKLHIQSSNAAIV